MATTIHTKWPPAHPPPLCVGPDHVLHSPNSYAITPTFQFPPLPSKSPVMPDSTFADLAYPSPELSSPSCSSSSQDHQNASYSPLYSDSTTPDHPTALVSAPVDPPAQQLPSRPALKRASDLPSRVSPLQALVPLLSLPMSHTTTHPSFTSPRRRNKLRKPPPSHPSFYTLPPLSFVPEPEYVPQSSNFISLLSSPTSSPTASTITPHYIPENWNNADILPSAPSSPSMASATTAYISSLTPLLHHESNGSRGGAPRQTRTLPTRKLTKRRPSLSGVPSSTYTYSSPAADESMHPEEHQEPHNINRNLVDLLSALEPTLPSPPNRSNSVPTQTNSSSSSSNIRRRRTTLSFSLRRRKKDRQPPSQTGDQRGSASEVGHNELKAKEREWLPPFRAISPFRVHIPTQRQPSWRDATLSAGDAPPTNSASTDALASLAWTGVYPSSSSTAFMIGDGNGGGWRSTWSLEEEPGGGSSSPVRGRAKFTLGEPESTSWHDSSTDPSPAKLTGAEGGSRPRLMRRHAALGARRRWTLAMAMTDEGITDEVLVEELERMRMRREVGLGGTDVGEGIWRGLKETGVDAEDGAGKWGDANWIGEAEGGPSEENGDVYGGPSEHPADLDKTSIIPSHSLPSLPPYNPSSAAAWQTARRALLTCRELVRTERHYLFSLRSLLSCSTLTPPPPLMLRYVEQLVIVSESLLNRMEEDPSAWGVAVAFLGSEERLEGAFVGWCGVVGSWFSEDQGGSGRWKMRLSKSRVLEEHEEDESPSGPVSPLKKTVSTWRKSMPSIASFNVSAGVAPASNIPSPGSAAAFLGRRRERESAQGHGKGLPSVRDLAILPTQRVMRYALLYRDLLAHTPSTSPSRALVERAVDAACRIAQKCDRAQGNAAFLQRR